MTAEFDDLFNRLAAQTQRMANGEVPVPDTEAEPLEVEGADEHGLVTVRMVNGKVSGVDVDPQAFRGSHVLGDLIKQAVNTAIDAHIAAMMASLQNEDTDYGALTKELRSIQLESLRAMDKFTGGMQEALAQAVRLSR